MKTYNMLVSCKSNCDIVCTYHSLDIRSLECGKAQVPYLHQTSGAVDEDVVALEVAVDDGWSAGVQEEKASQDLPPPAANHLRFGPETPHVTEGGREGGREGEREGGMEGGREGGRSE